MRPGVGGQCVRILEEGGVEVTDTDGNSEKFDVVVFACHAQQAADILRNAGEILSANQQDVCSCMADMLGIVLGISAMLVCVEHLYAMQSLQHMLDSVQAIEHRPNEIYVHTDDRLMPKQKECWSSWNCVCVGRVFITIALPLCIWLYVVCCLGGFRRAGNWQCCSRFVPPAPLPPPLLQVCLEGDLDKDITVTYWLNILQNLPTSTNIFVTLNPPPELMPRMCHTPLLMILC